MFRAKLCTCVQQTGNVNPQRQAVTFVLNSLLGVNVVTGEVLEPTVPSTPNACPLAEFVPVRDLYVCALPGAEPESCDRPLVPISEWNASVSLNCRDIVANSADKGKCIPQSASSCVLQNCPCGQNDTIPAPVPPPVPV